MQARIEAVQLPTPARARSGLALAWPLLLAGALAVTPSHAAPVETRTEAKQLVASLRSQSTDPGVERALRRAESALQKADLARKDQAAVKAAYEASALEWAKLANDWARVRRREQEAAEREAALSKLTAEIVHARALLEETQARRGRAQALVQQLRVGQAKPEETTAPKSPEPKSSTEPKSAVPANKAPAAAEEKAR